MKTIIIMFICIGILISIVLASWTQDELSYVITALSHHTANVPWIIALLVNFVTNGFAITFDFIVWVFRISTGT